MNSNDQHDTTVQGRDSQHPDSVDVGDLYGLPGQPGGAGQAGSQGQGVGEDSSERGPEDSNPGPQDSRAHQKTRGQGSSVYQKLSRVLAELPDAIATGYHNLYNRFYATQSDYASTVRQLLGRHGLAIDIETVDIRNEEAVAGYEKDGAAKPGFMTTARIAVQIVDGETGDTWGPRHYEGSAINGPASKSDGGAQAMTEAMKLFLKYNFLMSVAIPASSDSIPQSPPNPSSSSQGKRGGDGRAWADLCQAVDESGMGFNEATKLAQKVLNFHGDRLKGAGHELHTKLAELIMEGARA